MKTIFLLLSIGLFAAGCDQPGTLRRSKQGDSVEIVKLLKDVYRWHDKNLYSLSDFVIIVKDTVQVGVNYDSLNRTLGGLRQTGFFSSGFIDNYKKLADSVNDKLVKANPKLLNEINFSFQDADPWTGFQDSAPDFWEKFSISDYTTATDSVFLKWKIQEKDWSSEPYGVGFSFEKGKWRVAFLEGFDIKSMGAGRN